MHSYMQEKTLVSHTPLLDDEFDDFSDLDIVETNIGACDADSDESADI